MLGRVSLDRISIGGSFDNLSDVRTFCDMIERLHGLRYLLQRIAENIFELKIARSEKGIKFRNCVLIGP